MAASAQAPSRPLKRPICFVALDRLAATKAMGIALLDPSYSFELEG